MKRQSGIEKINSVPFFLKKMPKLRAFSHTSPMLYSIRQLRNEMSRLRSDKLWSVVKGNYVS